MISAAAARAAAQCNARWRLTSALPFQNPGWDNGSRGSRSGAVPATLASYLLAVVTLSHHSAATTTATATRARAMRHPAAHAPYHPIQLGSMPARPAACQATVLTVTAITALTN